VIRQILENSVLPLVGFLLVLPPWIWLAVRTKQCLQIISSRSIPYPKRTIWLIKILALIIGAGGVLGVSDQLGIPWYVAISFAAAVVLFALRENVQEIIPPLPNQNARVYQSSWQEYGRLRNAYMRSLKWLGVIGVLLILLTAFSDKLPNPIRVVLFSLWLVSAVACIAVMYVRQFKWLRWTCPRCGCAFRGLWWRPLMPKTCVYCGLPREDNTKLVPANSR
jgi:hypothetical protein